MFKFELDPPSAYTNSYIDIKFIITLENTVDEAIVELKNETTNENLVVVGVLNGHILGDTKAVITNSNKIEGFVNIFNKDKMNINLSKFASVDISAIVTVKGVQNKKTLVFYNQSKSLDAEILPFDINLPSKTIDVANNKPFKIQITANSIARYEFCIRSADYKEMCTFEIVTKNGVSEIDVPVAVLWHDLKVEQELNGPYELCFVKLEGINFNKMMNRVYIPIQNATLDFNGDELQPLSQTRLDPIGNVMSQEFVLSDRYFVHTHRDFSRLARLNEITGARLRYLTMYLYEAQNMRMIDESVSTMSNKVDKRIEARKSIRATGLKSPAAEVETNQQFFFKTFGQSIQKNTEDKKQNTLDNSNTPKKQSGCGCARKKQI